MEASVKIMLSYDYCHFEVCKSIDGELTNKQIDELRKDVQRLADNAVSQYIKAKDMAKKRMEILSEKNKLEQEAKCIKSIPESEWTAEQKAKIKAIADDEYWSKYDYNYEDDYEDCYVR